MNIKKQLKKLETLSFNEVIEVVKKYYLYVKPEDKESFFKELNEISEYLVSAQGLRLHFCKTIKKYRDYDYLHSSKALDSYDLEEESKFIVAKILRYNKLGAKYSKLLLFKAMPELYENGCSLDDIMDVVEECDTFLSPNNEEKLTSEITSYFVIHSDLLDKACNNSECEEKCLNDLLSILMPYLSNDVFFKKLKERSKYQYSSKKYIREFLGRLNKKQLTEFTLFVITIRTQSQIFMSKRSAYHLLSSLREVLTNSSCVKEPYNITEAFKLLTKKELVDMLVDHADLNLILWENTLQAYLEKRNIEDAKYHVSVTLALKNQTKGTGINNLI